MSAPDDTGAGSLLEHLVELRSRLLRGIVGVVAALLALLPFTSQLYTWLALPLVSRLPAGQQMIALNPAGAFFAPIKLAFFLAVFVAAPWLLYQAWAFIAPGLYQQEKRLFAPLFVTSVLLFYAGMAFAFFVVFPLIFGFLVAVAPEGVAIMTDINEYLDFVLTLFFAFGLAFEVPVATVLLVWAGFTTPGALAEKRQYVLLGCFVIGMFLTPPDVISQTLLAVPMYLLYEAGIVMSRVFLRGWKEVEAQRAERGKR